MKLMGFFVKYKNKGGPGCKIRVKGGKRCGLPLMPGHKTCQEHLAKPKTKHGFSVDYYEYIESPEWRKKSDAAKAAAGWRCQLCNRGRKEGVVLNAHHRTYENLGDEKPGDLTVLCQDCHKLYEKSKKKRGLK